MSNNLTLYKDCLLASQESLLAYYSETITVTVVPLTEPFIWNDKKFTYKVIKLNGKPFTETCYYDKQSVPSEGITVIEQQPLKLRELEQEERNFIRKYPHRYSPNVLNNTTITDEIMQSHKDEFGLTSEELLNRIHRNKLKVKLNLSTEKFVTASSLITTIPPKIESVHQESPQLFPSFEEVSKRLEEIESKSIGKGERGDKILGDDDLLNSFWARVITTNGYVATKSLFDHVSKQYETNLVFMEYMNLQNKISIEKSPAEDIITFKNFEEFQTYYRKLYPSNSFSVNYKPRKYKDVTTSYTTTTPVQSSTHHNDKVTVTLELTREEYDLLVKLFTSRVVVDNATKQSRFGCNIL